MKLTDAKIKAIRDPGYYPDGAGLYLQVSNSGSRSWVYRFTSPVTTKRREFGLGTFNVIGLKAARDRSAALRVKVSNGVDPVEERAVAREQAAALKAAPHGKTFKEVAIDYIKAQTPGWKSVKHRQQWESSLEQYAYPIIGDLSPNEVTTAHVLQIISPRWSTTTETMVRVRSRIEAILDAAKVQGYRQAGDNPARWVGHLDNVLPDPNKVAPVVHFPALEYHRAPEFMSRLREHVGITAMCLEFAILTCVRSNEARGATWAEIDLENRIWTIPAERMKLRRKGDSDHRVPLSRQAVELLERMKEYRFNHLVFCSVRKNVALSDMSLTSVTRRMDNERIEQELKIGKTAAGWRNRDGRVITCHGFRSTFRDWLGDMTTHANELGELSLGHKVSNQVEAAYRRSDMFQKRIDVMQDWADFLDEVE